MHAPSLTRLDPPGGARPRGVVLVLHGGKPHSMAPVDARSASWRRAHALQRAMAPGAHAAGVAVWLLRYRHRGWNDMHQPEPSPVPDARWALDEARSLDTPVVLLGHSMGARTAVQVADDPQVRGVVALAPWFEPHDRVDALRDRTLAAAHGRTDKITSARRTQDFCRRAEDVARRVDFHDMGRVGHYMLRRVEAWNDFALQSSLAALAD